MRKYISMFMNLYLLSFVLLALFIWLDLDVFQGTLKLISICFTVVVGLAGGICGGLAKGELKKIFEENE